MYASLMILPYASAILSWKKKKRSSFFFLCLFFFCVLFLLRLFFFCIFFQMIIRRQFIVESCASPSNNLISLSYSMPVFSANLFRLFAPTTFKIELVPVPCKPDSKPSVWVCLKVSVIIARSLKVATPTNIERCFSTKNER